MARMYPEMMLTVTDGIFQLVQDKQEEVLRVLREQHAWRKPFINLLPIQSFYEHERAQGYRAPALYVLGEETDLNPDRGQQFADQTHTMTITVLVEGRSESELVRQLYLYTVLLYTILDQASFQSNMNGGQVTIIVTRITYDPILVMEGSDRRVFRKDASLHLMVSHQEAKDTEPTA